MYPESKSLISYTPLDENNRYQHEYTKQEIKRLLGDDKYQMRLNFTRQAFISELPYKSKGMSISGYQPKLSLKRMPNNQLEAVNEYGEYILKPSPESFPFLAENESATMKIMKHLGFETPENGLTRFYDGDNLDSEKAFLIKRFDRLNNGEKIHQEQMDSAMGIMEKYGKIKQDDEQYVSYEQIGKFIVNRVSSALVVKRDFFKRVLCAFILGNNDLHLRNFSLLHLPNAQFQLSPIYDFISVAPYPSYISIESALALPLLEKQQGGGTCYGVEKYCTYCKKDFIEFGLGIGLSKGIIEKDMHQIISQQEIMKEIYTQSFIPKNQVKLILKWIDAMIYYLQQD